MFLKSAAVQFFSTPRYLVVVCVSALLLASTVSAGSLYRWVDDKGVTHFSAVPPPDAVADGGIEEERLPGQSSGVSNSYRSLEGIWWARSDNNISQYLQFRNGSFSTGEEYFQNQSIHRSTVASGPYRIDGSAIVLTYFTHTREPLKLDQRERLSILRQTDTELSVLLPQRPHPLVYQRLVKERSNTMSGRLYGHWRDSRHLQLRYVFDHGTFDVLAENASGPMRRLRSGNWRWEEPEMFLTYVLDLTAPVDGANPPKLHWQVSQGGTPNELAIKDMVSGETFTLARVR
ncbi:MAG: hypothetical protein CVV10_00415 [Gammaproteobacteria bacterium HGW-Gammaproteobacteria-14]|nr:MAG: hypothetical protein CVV10_00415 [Gammaproteobacteria bacterium HGW-Gammaproteobacteria-14]